MRLLRDGAGASSLSVALVATDRHRAQEPNAKEIHTLREIRGLARIASDPNELFIRGMLSVISAQRQFHEIHASKHNLAAYRRNIARLSRAAQSLHEDISSCADGSGELAPAWVELQEKSTEILALFSWLEWATDENKLPRGRQKTPVVGPGAPQFNNFAKEVYLLVRRFGGQLTVDRNRLEYGTFARSLNLLRRILPARTFSGMSARRLDTIKRHLDQLNNEPDKKRHAAD